MEATLSKPRRLWPWLLALGLGGPLVCCGGLIALGVTAAKPAEQVMKPGLEPAGTCAFEGDLSSAAWPAEARGGSFRLAGVPCGDDDQGYGRDGWQPPGVFAVTGKDGRFALAGVIRSKLVEGAPKLGLYLEAAPWKELEVKAPATEDAPVELNDLVLEK